MSTLSSNRVRDILAMLLPLALAALCLTPFLHKAFTIDDTLFLLQAQNAVVDPLHPTAFDVVWSDDVWVRCSAIMPSGPLMAYLLVPTILSGGKEAVAHSTQLAIFLLGIVGVMRLARRVNLSFAGSVVAGLVLATSPGAVTMASTAMPDVPAMTLSVFGIERLLAFRDGESKGRFSVGLVAALCLGLAALARPHVSLMLGIGFLFLAHERPGHSINRFEWRLREVWPIAVATALVVLVAFVSRDPMANKGNLASATLSLANTGWAQWQRHLAAFFLHWSFATPIVLAVVLLAPFRVQFTIVVTLMIAGGAVLSGYGFRDHPWMAVPLGFSGAVLVRVLEAVPFKDVPGKLAAIAWLLLALPVVTYVHLPNKYILPSIPLAALAVGALFDEVRAKHPTRALLTIAFVSVLGTVYSIHTVRADSIFAALGRRAAAELVAPRVEKGERVWFFGRWGFQWYALRAGAMPLTRNTIVPPGEIIIGPSERYDSGPLIKRFPDVEVVEKLTTIANAHVMNQSLNAGMYSNWWGMLPSSPGEADVETFTVWRATYRKVDP